MNQITDDTLANVFFTVNWKSDVARHTECFQAHQVNVWRDFLPDQLLRGLRGKQAGDNVKFRMNASDIVAPLNENKIMKIRREQVAPCESGIEMPELNVGRFYPLGLVSSLPGVFSANREPFRCVDIRNGHLKIDLNHPLSGRDITVEALVGSVANKKSERGGTSVAWLEDILKGPGMQARWRGNATDYFSGIPFKRDDERDDAKFYKETRFVQHIDDNAVTVVKNTYNRFLSDGMDVLDLMSSWTSHIDDNLKLRTLTGLGMNELELKKNPLLTQYTVQDLNKTVGLPYKDASFEVVICTVSVEYLTQPVKMFSEVRRVLRPGGLFIVTASNRWFPSKAIRIWRDLHEFERIGLILEYFLMSGGFEQLNTYSMRGLPRPVTDKYFPQQRFSDPVYVVWGRKKSVG